jgi:hypothetical protein
MPTLKNKINIVLHQIFSIFFLAVICCAQIYNFTHLHHFHENNSLAFEVSYHPSNLAIVHSSAHYHNESQSSHSDDHQSQYANKTYSNTTRSQSTNNLTTDEQVLFSPIVYLPPVGFEKYISLYQQSPFIKEHYASFVTIRGPPLFG